MVLDQLSQDMKTALKAGEKEKLSVIRMAISDIKNARIQKKDDLTDLEMIQVLKRAVKSRKESAEQYRDADRADLAEKEEREVVVLEAYLPQAIAGDALVAIVAEAIEETGATSMKDMGGVMKAVMAKHGAAIDGKALGALVKEKLAGNPRGTE